VPFAVPFSCKTQHISINSSSSVGWQIYASAPDLNFGANFLQATKQQQKQQQQWACQNDTSLHQLSSTPGKACNSQDHRPLLLLLLPQTRTQHRCHGTNRMHNKVKAADTPSTTAAAHLVRCGLAAVVPVVQLAQQLLHK
jgi:hypothetical protein